MSRSVNPARIGLFVLVGAFLAVATVIYVGSIRLFATEETFLLYFKESVNGLSVGSPVKFKGVTIGAVSEIRLAYNQDPSLKGFYVPVFVKINQGKLRGDPETNGQFNLSDWSEFNAQIRDGLRARLQLESIITGQLFIELDYIAEPGDPFQIVQEDVVYKEIPTSPSVMAEIGSSTADVLAKLATIDVQGISTRLTNLLDQLNGSLSQLEPGRWNESVLNVTGELERLLQGADLRPTLDRLNLVLDDLHNLSQKLDQSLDPAVEDYHRIVNELSDTLRRSQTVMDNVNQWTAPDAELQREFVDALAEVRRAARSARELIEYLDRNPQALLSGRAEP